MKFIIIFIIIVSVSFAGEITKNYFSPKAGKLVIVIRGFQSDNGSAKVAVANSESNYHNHREPFIGLTLDIKTGTAETVLEDLNPGYYALKIFHDADDNNDLNTNFIGYPIEDYGFSNNASGIFGIPSWNNAKFYFDGSQKIVEVNIN